jgi:hypothetical protein
MVNIYIRYKKTELMFQRVGENRHASHDNGTMNYRFVQAHSFLRVELKFNQSHDSGDVVADQPG